MPVMRSVNVNGQRNSSLISLRALSVNLDAGTARLNLVPEYISADTWRGWLLPLGAEDAVLGALSELLSDAERGRVDTIRVARVRRQFIHVRGALRLLLDSYLGPSVAHMDFAYGGYGKPALMADNGWYFNVAHSGDYAVLVIANGNEVGVDIERCRAVSDLEAMASMVLSPAEKLAWRALPADERHSAFFRLWTRKEAVAKAVGQGLRLGFPELSIGFEHPGATGSRNVKVGECDRCCLTTLAAPDGYVAALAVRDRAGSL